MRKGSRAKAKRSSDVRIAPRAEAATTSPGAAPFVLLPYQQKWVGDKADVAVWEKSRRIGASWCDAADSALTAGADDEAGGMDVLYIGYSEDMTREYLEDCAMWLRNFSLAAGAVMETVFRDIDEHGETREIKAFRIDCASGKKILGLTSRPRSLRGKQGKVTIDEAAFHDDFAGLLKAAIAMLIWGGRVRILSTHNGEDNPFNLMVADIKAKKLPYSLHHTDFREALDAGLFDRVKLVLGKRLKEKTREEWEAKVREQYGAGAAEELDCIPAMGSGVYIPRTVVERCQEKRAAGEELCRVIRLAKPAEWMLSDKRLEEADRWIADVLKPAIDALPAARSVLGRDFGRSGDLSIESVLQEVEPRQWRATLTLELRRIPFDVQEKINQYLLENLPLWHHAKYDARGNGQQLAEAALQKYGPARIECVMASPKWYAENFPPYKAALEDRSIELPKGEDEITDHRRVVLVGGYPKMDEGKDKGSDGEQRHGDRAVARVLAWAAARAEGQPPAGESIDAREEDFLPDAMTKRRRTTMFRRAA